ncbi:uncharacterized protein G2W53_000944 [Senna tora]|uniref:RNase H type-1 domain-containing protein n=1 Tax=Senna tora TaxID=362788 RepID=A0A834XGP8_9FABA|nr:uncharacterized protein G2W53_000944 [Senna tora]
MAKDLDQPWVQILKAIYYPSTSLWEEKKKRQSSWSWASIDGRDLIKKHKAWIVGNGKNISILNERWIPGGEVLWSLPNGSPSKVSDFLIPSQRKWDEQTLLRWFSKEVGRRVLSIHLGDFLREDTICWPLTPHRQYTVKTWNKGKPLEMNLELQGSTKGQRFHLERLQECYSYKGTNPYPDKAIQRALNSNSEFLKASLALPPPSIPAASSTPRRWAPPPQDVVKLNVDASTDLSLNVGAIAVVARNYDGEMLTGWAKRIPCFSALQAEATAIKEALLFANSLDIGKVIVESDNKQIVNALSFGPFPWAIVGVLQEIDSLIASFISASVSWTSRSANTMADTVAKLSLKHMLLINWSWAPTVSVRAKLH